ncbi:MAG: RDD family protein [Steroidobacteraceae bacterium]|jgi:uncharacterized RDD family membrane protein YckC
MTTSRICSLVLLWAATVIAASCTIQPAGAADNPTVSSPATPGSSVSASSADDKEPIRDQAGRDQAEESPEDRDDRDGSDESRHRDDRDSDWLQHAERSSAHSHRHDRDLVNIGHDSDLPAGEWADSVVSIFGSSNAAGDATDVVSVFGNTKVTGSVRHSAVAVLGNSSVDGPVDGDVVAVLGNVQLGPNARVGGDVVAVGGKVERDPAAQVHGTVQTVGSFAGFAWLKPWIENCLFYGRPLALAPGLGWAWGLALSLLALYVGLALLFPDGVTRCVQTLESRPGMTLVAALITVLLMPVLLILLCITFVGIAAVPFVGAGLFCASLFGKAVVLAWLGRRTIGARGRERFGHPALAVLVGGAIVLVLYLVPVLGFIVYKLLGLFGLGAVVYTLVLLAREHRAQRSNHGAASSGGAVYGPSVAAPDPAAAFAAAAHDAAAAPGPAAGAAAAPPTSAAAPIRSAAGLPRAGFWIRMAALLIDALLVGFLMGMLHHGFHLELLVLAIYGAVMWKMRGSTVGGIVFDLQVVRLDDRAVDWETAVVRALGCFLSLAVVGLGFFWIAFDAGKQGWHDKIAGTAVVRVRKGVPLV